MQGYGTIPKRPWNKEQGTRNVEQGTRNKDRDDGHAKKMIKTFAENHQEKIKYWKWHKTVGESIWHNLVKLGEDWIEGKRREKKFWERKFCELIFFSTVYQLKIISQNKLYLLQLLHVFFPFWLFAVVVLWHLKFFEKVRWTLCEQMKEWCNI